MNWGILFIVGASAWPEPGAKKACYDLPSQASFSRLVGFHAGVLQGFIIDRAFQTSQLLVGALYRFLAFCTPYLPGHKTGLHG